MNCNEKFLKEAKELEKVWAGMEPMFIRAVTAKMLESQRLWNEKPPLTNYWLEK